MKPSLSDKDKDKIVKAILIAGGSALAAGLGEIAVELLKRWLTPDEPADDDEDDDEEVSA